MREKFASFAYKPFILSRDQLNAYIQAESARNGAVIKKTQIALD